MVPVAVPMLVIILLAMVVMVMIVVDATKRVKNDSSIIVLDFCSIEHYVVSLNQERNKKIDRTLIDVHVG